MSNSINENQEYFDSFGIKIIYEEFNDIDSLELLIVKFKHWENYSLDMLPLYEIYGDNLRVVNNYKDIFILKQ